MARDSSGTQNQPHYAGSGAPSDAADLTEVSDYAALVGNRKAGTNSQRTGLTGADLWVGLQFFETDTGVTYNYTSTGWVAASPVDARTGTGLSKTPSVRAGTGSGTTSAGGDVSVTFPTPFANSCWVVIPVDSNTGAGIGLVGFKIVSKSTTGFTARHYSPSTGAVITGLASTFGYIAFGE